jgi:UDP-glucose 4-epimerase
MASELELRVGVTGGSGFIGNNLLGLARGMPDIVLIPYKGDLLDTTAFGEFLDRSSPLHNFVYLAGAAQGTNHQLLRSNIEATVSFLEAIGRTDLGRVTFVSSGAVYGNTSNRPTLETDPLEPNTFYGFSKLVAEENFRLFDRNGCIRSTIVRLPNVYGPGSTHGVVANIAKHVSNGNRVTIYGDGSQVRQFVHVNDVCSALLACIQTDVSGCFNIGSDIVMTINELVGEFEKHADFEIEYQPAANTLESLVLDWNKARLQLAYFPSMSKIDTTELLC